MAMILVCPECSTNYELASGLPEGGTKVRCTTCSNVWHATDDDLIAPEDVQSSKDNSGDQEIPAVSPHDDNPLEEIDFNEIEEELSLAEENSQDNIDGLFDEPEAEGEDNSQDDIDGLFDEPEAEGEDNSQDDIDGLFDEPEAEGEDNSQDDIDGLFDEPEAEGEDNSQDDIDGLFDEPEAEGEDNSQDDIDGLFDEPEAEGEDNSQGDIDGLFDEPEEVAAQPETPEPEQEENDPFVQALDQTDEEDEPIDATASTTIAAVNGPIWKRFDQKTMVGWACYVVVLGLIAIFLISARVTVVRAVPAMAKVYDSLGLPVNVRGVMFTNVRQSWDVGEKVLKLRIEGEITNLTNNYKPVPPVIFTALSQEKREVFRWVASIRKKPLLPGEKAPFIVQVPAPPNHSEHMLLRFE